MSRRFSLLSTQKKYELGEDREAWIGPTEGQLSQYASLKSTLDAGIICIWKIYYAPLVEAVKQDAPRALEGNILARSALISTMIFHMMGTLRASYELSIAMGTETAQMDIVEYYNDMKDCEGDFIVV